jgi:hypothetical protein
VTIGSTPITTSGTITLAIATATASQQGLLSSTDWTTFNNKQSTISLSAIGSTPNANAATLTGSVLNLQPASDSFGGVVTTGTQTFAGAKTFNSTVSASGIFSFNDSTSASPNQFQVTGVANINKQLLIGYNTIGNGYGSIQPVFQGTAFTPLVLNGSGGNVLIFQTNDTGEQLQVNGTGKFSSSVTATQYTNTSQVAMLLNNSGVNNDFRLGSASSQFRVVNSANTVALLEITNAGAATFSSTIKTAAPTGGTAQPWKLGSVITDSCGVPTTFSSFANTLTDKFIEVEINGVFYYIPVRIPGWC